MSIKAFHIAYFPLLTLAFACGKASAMSFEVVMMRGEPAIRATGEIVAGDAERLHTAMMSSSKHSLGYYTLVLDSLGGNVAAAFEIATVMDTARVNAYVAPGGRCVSACAAIVFIAGREHIAAPGGLLGFHGCYNAVSKRINYNCNEAISNHAFRHGTSYGAVMAFIERVPYDQVVWIDNKQADCWAINKYDVSPKPSEYEQCAVEAMRAAMRPIQK